MNYRQDKKHFSRRTYLLAVVIIAMAVLFVWGVSIPKVVVNVLTSIATPIWGVRGEAGADADTLQTLFSSKQKLAEENDALRFQLREARLALLGTDTLRKEFNELLDIASSEGEKIVARVIVRPPTTIYDTFIVNRGSEDGVTLGSIIFAGGNVVLGEIIDVYGNTSKVRLYSTDGIETVVLIGDDLVTTNAIGQGGGNFVSYVPRDVSVRKGSAVVLASGGSETVVGIVGEIEEEPGNTVKTILFRSPINSSTMIFVNVVSE